MDIHINNLECEPQKFIKVSAEQMEIINNLKNYNVLVDAIAGSGKTTTILHIAKKYKKCKILLLTYNSKLKIETKERCIAEKIKNVDVHTYHSFSRTYNSKAYTDQG